MVLFHGMNFETKRSPFEAHGPGLRSAGLYKARGCGSPFHQPVKLPFIPPCRSLLSPSDVRDP